MDDRTAASAGFTFAGIAFAASLFGWLRRDLSVALLAVVLAGVALAAFALRRYGRLDRRSSAVVAAVGSVGAVVVGLYVLFQTVRWPVAVVTILAGGVAAVAAYADWLGLDREALASRVGVTARGAGLGALGIVAIVAWSLLVAVLVRPFAPGLFSNETQLTVLNTLLSGAGTLSVVAAFLVVTGRGLPYLDVRWPDLRGLAYAVVGTLVIFGGNLAISVVFQQVGIQTAQHTIIRTAKSDPTILLALVPLSYLVIAPGEELLFRNVIQKRLREVFSPVGGIVIASAVFASVHLFSYLSASQGLLATMNTLAIIFLLALVLGTAYERTDNVVVTILIHGSFDAIAFAITYWQLTGMGSG